MGTQIPGGVCGVVGGGWGELCLKILTAFHRDTDGDTDLWRFFFWGGGGERCLKILAAFLRGTDGNTDP